MSSVQKGKMKRALLFLPVWVCLFTLSITRTVVGFPKVKFSFQRIAIKKISTFCQKLYGNIRNPYRIGNPWYIPPYYIKNIPSELAQASLEQVHEIFLQKRQQNRETQEEPNHQCYQQERKDGQCYDQC